MRCCITDKSEGFLFVSSPLSINSQAAFYCIPNYAVYLLPWYVRAAVVQVPRGFTSSIFLSVSKQKFLSLKKIV